MANNKNTPEVKKKNNLTTPLCISLAANVILLIALFCVAVWGTGTNAKLQALRASNASTSTETTAVETTAAETAAAETESAETEAAETAAAEDTFYFEDGDGNQVEVEAYEAYINGEFICAGDASDWVFTYDEDSAQTTVAVTDEDGNEVGTYSVDFYATTDEENPQLLCNIHDDDNTISYIYYLQNILDDDDETQGVGMYFVNATDDTNQVILYTPEAYETYVVEAEAETTETPAAETAAASK